MQRARKRFSSTLSQLLLASVALYGCTSEPDAASAKREYDYVPKLFMTSLLEGGEAFKAKRSLTAWIEDEDRRSLLQDDPLAVWLFNWLPYEYGGPAEGQAWVPRVILVGKNKSVAVHYQFHSQILPLMSVETLREREGEHRFVELVPIRTDEESFTEADIIPESMSVWPGEREHCFLHVKFRPGRDGDFIRWTETIIDRSMPTLFDGYLISMPTLVSSLPGYTLLHNNEVADQRKWVEEQIPLLQAAAGASRRDARSEDPFASELVERHGDDPRFVLAWGRILVTSADAERRATAMSNISVLGPGSRECIPLLVQALVLAVDDAEADEVILAITRVGEGSQDAVPLLEDIRERELGRRKELAERALAKIQ